MKVLIVYAHPEEKSFNSSMLNRSVATLKSLGHEVRLSDLYAMEFNPWRASVTSSADDSLNICSMTANRSTPTRTICSSRTSRGK